MEILHVTGYRFKSGLYLICFSLQINLYFACGLVWVRCSIVVVDWQIRVTVSVRQLLKQRICLKGGQVQCDCLVWYCYCAVCNCFVRSTNCGLMLTDWPTFISLLLPTWNVDCLTSSQCSDLPRSICCDESASLKSCETKWSRQLNSPDRIHLISLIAASWTRVRCARCCT